MLLKPIVAALLIAYGRRPQSAVPMILLTGLRGLLEKHVYSLRTELDRWYCQKCFVQNCIRMSLTSSSHMIQSLRPVSSRTHWLTDSGRPGPMEGGGTLRADRHLQQEHR